MASQKPEEYVAELMPREEHLYDIGLSMLYGKKAEVEAKVKEVLESGVSPLEVINDCLVQTMSAVSKLYGDGLFYLPQVMIAADAMSAGIRLCEERMGKAVERKGKVVMHVAEGDIHDLGKTIAAALLNANGYEVIDLGKDVPVDEVVKAVEEHEPLLLTGTALMTTTMTAFPKIAERLKEKGVELPFICGGGALSRQFVEEYDMGIYASSAVQGPTIADLVRKGMGWRELRERYDELIAEREQGNVAHGESTHEQLVAEKEGQ